MKTWQVGTSAVVSTGEYDFPQVSPMRSASFGWRRQISPVSFPLIPRFATSDIGQSSSVSTQKYPSSPVSRSSTPLLGFRAVFDPECSESETMDSPVSVVDVHRGVVDSPELGEVVASGMSTITSRFSPLSPRLSPTSYEAPVDSKDVCPAADRVVPLLTHESLVSQLSSVQLSHNRVRHRTP